MAIKLQPFTVPFVAPTSARWSQPFLPPQERPQADALRRLPAGQDQPTWGSRAFSDAWADPAPQDADPLQRPRVLLVCGLARDTGADRARTLRLVEQARSVFDAAGVESDLLDLGRLTADCGRRIEPSTGGMPNSLPLFREPHDTGSNQAMEPGAAEWGCADGMLILTPAHWQRTSSVLQMMIARGVGLAAAWDRGEHAVHESQAAWSPLRGAGERAYGLVVHGDMQRALDVRRALCDWLDWMGLIDACEQARLDHFLGFGPPCGMPAIPPEGEAALDNEVRAAASALVHAMAEIRAGRLGADSPLLARAWPR